MTRLIRMCAIAAAAVLTLMLSGVAALVLFVDPNDYRDDISDLAQQQAGIQLTLKGDLSWSFYPVLGFKVRGVSLALVPDMPTLMDVDTLTVGVRLLPLLSKQIDIDALDVTGLQAQLVVDAKGNNNWQRPAGADATVATAATADANVTTTPTVTSTKSMPVVRIPALTVHDSTIRYQDKKAKLDYSVAVPLLQLKNVSLDEPFPVELRAQLRDNATLDVTLALQAMLRTDLAAQRYQVSDIVLSSTIAGIFSIPVVANLAGDIIFDQAADNAEIVLNKLQLGNMQASATINATAVSKAPGFKGTLTTNTFNLKSMLTSLGIEPPKTTDSNALTAVQVNASFSGTPERIAIKPLQLKWDESTLSGEVAITDVAKQALQFDLKLDTLNADRYLAPETQVASGPANNEAAATAAASTTDASSAKKASSPASGGDLIPVDALRKLNLKGKFSINELVMHKISVRELALSVKAHEGDVQLNELRANLLQGSLSGNAGIDVRGPQPKITTRIDLQNLQTQDLLAQWFSAPVLSGRSSLSLNTTTQGNDSDTLLRQALGQLDMSLSDGVLHGVNINQLVVDALKQKLGDFTALMPDYETRLPKALKDETHLRNLLANMKVENGHLITPMLKANSEAGQFTANGDVDLVAQGFDYRFGVILNSLNDHKYLKGTEWPIRCRGNVNVPAKDWCRPDMNAIGNVVQKAASLALREKATEKLGEKLGMPGASEAEVKAEVKQKAQEKVNEQVSKQFDKWLKRNKKDDAPTAPALPSPPEEKQAEPPAVQAPVPPAATPPAATPPASTTETPVQ